MPWWAWLLAGVSGTLLVLVTLLLVATLAGVLYFKWREGEKHRAATEKE
jgi:hypothetical protein